MRKVIVWGFVLVTVCFALVLRAGGAVQQVPPSQDKPAQQVEVTNFPAVQQVAGAVNVGNLPLDGAGNVRVSGSGGSNAPADTSLEVTFHETDRNAVARMPLIALPPGYKTVSVSIQPLDDSAVRVRTWRAAFGSATAPLVHTALGDFQVFPGSVPFEAQQLGLEIQGDVAARFAVAGPYLQLTIRANSTDAAQSPPPPGTVYYVYLYLSN